MIGRLLGLGHRDTFGSVLERNRGLGPGFDVLRIALAILILIGHAKWISGAQSLGNLMPTSAITGSPGDGGGWVGWTQPIKLALVPAFFALSGFLVTGSALRLGRVSTFLAHRGLRIFPALVVEVLLSAFVLGAWLTTLPLSQYFAHPTMHRYLLNMFGEVSFYLRGVFEKNSVTSMVNANLWTLPAELGCYLIVMILMMTGLIYSRLSVLAVTICATLLLGALHHFYGISDTSLYYPPHVIILYFVIGVAMYHWRHLIPASPWIVLPVGALVYISLMFNSLTYVTAPLLAWLSLWIGMISFPRFRLLASGDYSYGIYLYGFPISQALITLVPWFHHRSAIFTLAALTLAILFAAFSWHVVEKRSLRLKRLLPERWFPGTPRERASIEATAEV
ncbi:acyltransferase [soil metagenome]